MEANAALSKVDGVALYILSILDGTFLLILVHV